MRNYYLSESGKMEQLIAPGTLQKLSEYRVLTGTSWEVKEPLEIEFDWWQFIKSSFSEKKKILAAILDRWCYCRMIERKIIKSVPEYAKAIKGEYWTFQTDKLLSHITDVLGWYRAIHGKHPSHVICNLDFLYEGSMEIRKQFPGSAYSLNITTEWCESEAQNFRNLITEQFRVTVIVCDYVEGIIPVDIPENVSLP